MPEPDVLVSSGELIRYAGELLQSLKVSAPNAKLVAESLVAANLRGVDSHGIQLLPYYIEQIESGDMNPHAAGRVAREEGCCLTYDCENGLGQATADTCCDHAIRIARQHGMALVVAREGNHFGAAAWWAQKISAQGNVGIVMCNASPLVPPWQGKEPRVGTNPICMSVPGPWLLDMATTTVAANKILKAVINSQPTIPPGWAMDREGVPTTDTATAFKGLPMPLGGYKGSGLAMLVEILCAVLSGGPMSTNVGGIRFRGKPVRVSHMFLAIDIARFMPVSEFTARMVWLVANVKSAAPAKGYDEVLVAGDPEWRMEQQRLRDGVPVGAGTWKVLLGLGEKLGVTAPRS